MPTREVVDKVVRPSTIINKECLWKTVPEDARGTPTVAVSHTWDYPFQYTLDMLEYAKAGHAPLAGNSRVSELQTNTVSIWDHESLYQ